MKRTKINIDGIDYFCEAPELTKAKEAIEKWSCLRSYVIDKLEETRREISIADKEGLTLHNLELTGYAWALRELFKQIEVIEKEVKVKFKYHG